MANIDPTLTDPGYSGQKAKVVWEQINQDDEGASHEVFYKGGIFGTINFNGTFDTGSYTLEGSLNGTDWFTIKAVDGSTNVVGDADNESYNFSTTAEYLRISNDNSGTTEDVDVTLHYVSLTG